MSNYGKQSLRGTVSLGDKFIVTEPGITPSGELSIVENGQYDVTNYASTDVNVPVGVFPEGTLNITENGEKTVINYEKVEVNVPVGVFPEGTLDITENGEKDITNYSKVNVNVPTSGGSGGIETTKFMAALELGAIVFSHACIQYKNGVITPYYSDEDVISTGFREEFLEINDIIIGSVVCLYGACFKEMLEYYNCELLGVDGDDLNSDYWNGDTNGYSRVAYIKITGPNPSVIIDGPYDL